MLLANLKKIGASEAMRISPFVVALGALVICSPVMAANDGPYIGIGVTHDNVASSGDLEGLGINGLGGTVFAGYNFAIGDAGFVGLEANFDLTSAKAGDEEDLAFRAKNSFGGSARIGYNVNNSTALYGRVGYQRGRATTKIDGVSETESDDGFRFGVGLETSLNQNAALRFEYNRTRYSVLSDEEKQFLEIESGGITNNQFVVALLYRL
jgi:outer membrane immunogenic protein